MGLDFPPFDHTDGLDAPGNFISGLCQVADAASAGLFSVMVNIEDLSRIKGFRFPRSVIGYAVWACHRFAL
ncbi:MAG: hypothetical protein NXH94_19765, partial [Rhodobacteraceae bacterium]|nr:hypothetical protein [Paracoccaceae bacterium]